MADHESVNSIMNELPLVGVRENGTGDDPRFQCNICGSRADFVLQLRLAKGNIKYQTLHAQQMPFYL
ncbi:MAG TPA: hypothetical protein VJZ68_06515 [Nitrososphaera sp.]|nr:hypothetical protein [Nitrososphaera sp.]